MDSCPLGHLEATSHQVIDGRQVAAALSAFDSVWDALIPTEQARILGLLTARITYGGRRLELALRVGAIGRLNADQLSRSGAPRESNPWGATVVKSRATSVRLRRLRRRLDEGVGARLRKQPAAALLLHDDCEMDLHLLHRRAVRTLGAVDRHLAVAEGHGRSERARGVQLQDLRRGTLEDSRS